MAWKWFFIGAAVLALIGCIVCAVAQNVGTLIGGTTLIGLAASGQQSFAFITGELVPIKVRSHALGTRDCRLTLCSIVSLPTRSCISLPSHLPALDPLFLRPSSCILLLGGDGMPQLHAIRRQITQLRCYYTMIIVNFLSGTLFFLFYYPPTFHEKFHDRSLMQQLKYFDYVGTVLFVGGFIVFLLGLSWGGSVYPWSSAHVIATLVIGGLVLIVFVFWETFAKLEEPLLPIHLFTNFAWVVACVLLGLGARY